MSIRKLNVDTAFKQIPVQRLVITRRNKEIILELKSGAYVLTTKCRIDLNAFLERWVKVESYSTPDS